MVLVSTEVPIERIVEVARLLGGSEVDYCPMRDHTCLTRRSIEPPVPDEDECTSCWAQYVIYGN